MFPEARQVTSHWILHIDLSVLLLSFKNLKFVHAF